MDRYKIGSYLKALRRFETYVWLGLIVVLTFMLTSFGWWVLFGRATSLPITSVSSLFVQEEVQPQPTSTPVFVPVEPETYAVQRGDSLWKIAHQWFGNGSKYHLIVTENKLSSDELEVGQVLRKPAQPTQETVTTQPEDIKAESYTVQPGDSLWKISVQQYGQGQHWVDVYRQPENRVVIGRNPNLIYPGQKLVLQALQQK